MNREANAGTASTRGLEFLRGGGELAELIRKFDWSRTSLGPIEDWPQSLRTATGMILLSPVPIVMLWGEDGIMIYNDAYSAFAGGRHPQLLGSKVREGWPEVADFNDNVMKVGLSGGTLSYKDQELTLYRHGRPEQVWMNLDYSPVLDESGKPAGVIAIVVETTERVRGDQLLRESESRFRALVNATSDVVYRMSADWTEVIQLDGRGFIPDTDQPRVRWVEDYVLPEDHALVRAAVDEAVRTKGTFHLEHRVRRVDGSVGWTLSRAIPLLDDNGDIVEWFGLASDITDRREAEDALRETTQRLDAVLNNTQMAVFLMDEQQQCVFANAAAEHLTGYSFDEMRGRPLHDVIHNKYPDGRPYPIEECPIDRAFPEQNQVSGEELFVHKDGHFYPVAFTASPVRDEHGRPIGTVIEARNIAQEKAREEALRESETRFREVFEKAGVGMIELDSDWNILASNEAYREITGRTGEALEGANCLSFTHPEDVATGETALRALAAGETGRVSFEKRYIRPDGEIIWVRSSLSRVTADPDANRFLKIVEDITEIREAREALREESQNLEILNRTGASLAAELDLESVVQLVTDAGVELTGADFGAFFYNVLDDRGESYMLYTLSGANRSDFERFPMPRNTAVFGPTFRGEGVVRSDDITKDPRYGKNTPRKGMPEGHLPVVSYLAVPVIGRSGEVIGGLFFGHKVAGRFTERHERLMLGVAAQAAVAMDNARLYQAVQRANETLEQRVQERTAELEVANEALRQAQKMEAIGQLTGGIAHDFNNLLTVIRGSADVLQRNSVDEAKRQRYIQAIADTADRASRLTSQLLAFARRQSLKPEVFDVEDRVRGIADMLRTVLGSRIKVHIESSCRECYVEADAAHFETALLNMAVNARDAMDGEGDLRIEIDQSRTPRSPVSQPPALGFATISVSDTGHGIPRENLDRIFEPFFTTKETGKGTGLGLSQVYGFAKQSGGEVEVRSEPGKGTTFTMYLPRVHPRRRTEEVESKPASAPRDGSWVLIVEDNEEVATFAENALTDLGFRTRRAASAAEAIAMLESGSRFDIVFSDIVMPGLSGLDLATEIRLRWPQLPIVLTTGYSDALAVPHDHSLAILQKPYSLEALSAALGEALKG